MSVDEEKSRLRAEARRLRDAARRTPSPDIAARLCANLEVALAAAGDIDAGAIVSGYWPMANELDVLPLLAWAGDRGYVSSLPVVTGPARALVFRRWRAGDALDQGTFGTHHPPPGAPDVRPDIVLAPLLAFDARGHRIGWGGGFYDRTLASLRGDGRVLAIGVAYASQQVDAVPHDEYDQRLDWLVTEEAALKVEAS